MSVALVVGPPGHGVVRHAESLAAAAGLEVVRRPEDVVPGTPVVLDVTDRLFGATADVSGPELARIGEVLRARGCPLVVALHDVPRPGGDAVQQRRAVVYRTVLAAAVGVLVHSEHERDRLARLGGPDRPVVVVPLPVPDPVRAPARPAGPPTSVTVLGFVYPGKGHDEVLAAMDVLPPDVALQVVGGASDGHADLLDRLRDAGRPVRVTGWVDDTDLPRWLHAATIPVAPNRMVSASASLATWWAHGRRPLAPDVGSVRELAVREPMALATYGPTVGDLRAALAAAWADPGSTWLPEGVRPGPDTATVAARRAGAVAAWTRRPA